MFAQPRIVPVNKTDLLQGKDTRTDGNSGKERGSRRAANRILTRPVSVRASTFRDVFIFEMTFSVLRDIQERRRGQGGAEKYVNIRG